MRPALHALCPRARLRRRVTTPCEVVRLRDFRQVGTRVLDMSSRGLLVETDLRVLTGEELVVSFASPGGGPRYDCGATITRVLHGRRRSDHHRAVGIAFDDLDPWTEMWLCEHLRAQPLARDARAPSRQ